MWELSATRCHMRELGYGDHGQLDRNNVQKYRKPLLTFWRAIPVWDFLSCEFSNVIALRKTTLSAYQAKSLQAIMEQLLVKGKNDF